MQGDLFLPLLLHHLVQALHAHAARHGAALLHLLHHVLDPSHTSDCSQHVRVHSFSHTLINLKEKSNYVKIVGIDSPCYYG